MAAAAADDDFVCRKKNKELNKKAKFKRIYKNQQRAENEALYKTEGK